MKNIKTRLNTVTFIAHSVNVYSIKFARYSSGLYRNHLESRLKESWGVGNWMLTENEFHGLVEETVSDPYAKINRITWYIQ